MNNIVIQASDKLAFSPALPLVLTTYAELIQQNLVVPQLPFNNESKIVWAEISGVVVGGIVWEYKPELNCAWIILSFTHKDHRRKGINKLCYSKLEELGKHLGATHLSSMVSIKNKERVDSMNAVGMQVVAYKTYKRI
jgi:GNAT superfamily N-acetyltransferase